MKDILGGIMNIIKSGFIVLFGGIKKRLTPKSDDSSHGHH